MKSDSLEPDDYCIDDKTGFLVFTETYHLKRGYCCGSGCRHCPYDHINVKEFKLMNDAPNE